MKKLLFLVSVSILFFTSCIPNPEEDPDPFIPPANLMLKKTVDTYDDGEIITTNFTYLGNKIVSVVDDSGEANLYFTYTDDLITRIEIRDVDGVVEQFNTFEYDDTKRLVTFKRIEPLDDLGYKETYVYNADGTVSVTSFSGDTLTQTDTDGTTGTVTFVNGEISQITSANATYSYTYDNKSNPFKNVLGMNKIAFVDGEGEGILHNIISETATVGGQSPVSFAYTFTYANDFPVTSRQDNTDGNYTTEYFY